MELQHHGILGMKWGVRRYQNKDGSLINSGKRKTSSAQPKVKKKSKTQLKYEANYVKQGFSKEDAERNAKNRIKTMKVLGVVGGLAVAGLTAYGVYKYREHTVDKIVKAGTVIQNISRDNNKGVEDAFYSAIHKHDKEKYVGYFGNQLLEQQILEKPGVFKTSFKNTSDLKVVSPKNARNILNDLIKNDKHFQEQLPKTFEEMSKELRPWGRAQKINTKALADLKKGKITNNVYEAFNVALVNHKSENQSIINKFYQSLKSKGYDAIKDINDTKNSSYDAKNPLIIFNGKEKLIRDKVEQILESDINQAYRNTQNRDIRNSRIKTGAQFTTGLLGLVGISSAKSNAQNNQIVLQYRNDHPNSKLSYDDIVKLMNGE